MGQEQAQYVHDALRIWSHTYVHATILGITDREVLRNDRFAVYRRDNHLPRTVRRCKFSLQRTPLTVPRPAMGPEADSHHTPSIATCADVAVDLHLHLRGQEQAHNVHDPIRIRAHADMHARVFRIPHWKVRGNERAAMNRGHDHLRQAVRRCQLRHGVDRRAIDVIATLLWIPRMRFYAGKPARAASKRPKSSKDGRITLHGRDSKQAEPRCRR